MPKPLTSTYFITATISEIPWSYFVQMASEISLYFFVLLSVRLLLEYLFGLFDKWLKGWMERNWKLCLVITFVLLYLWAATLCTKNAIKSMLTQFPIFAKLESYLNLLNYVLFLMIFRIPFPLDQRTNSSRPGLIISAYFIHFI